MKQSISTPSRGVAILLVAALLIVAILAGRAIMRGSDAEFAVKPATGSAQAMAAAATVEQGTPPRK